MRAFSKTTMSGLALVAAAASHQAGATTTTAFYAGTDAGVVQLSQPQSAQLQFSTAAIAVFNATRTSLSLDTPADGASLSVTTKTNAVTKVVSLSTASYALPLTSLTFNNEDGQVSSATFQGDMTFSITSPNLASPTGGYLAVSRLQVDLLAGTVRADVAGANGLTAQSGVALWTFDVPAPVYVKDALGQDPYTQSSCQLAHVTCSEYPIQPPYPDNSSTPAWLDAGKIPLSLNNWQLTDAGRAVWVQSLGFNTPGAQALSTASGNFASLTMAIPEPGTSALFALGFMGIATAHSARRRRHQPRP